MLAWLKEVRKKLGMRDAFVFGGLALLGVGVGMVYFPASLVVLGVVLLYLGLVGVPSWR